ncbi:MAG: transposase [Acidimicrobiia bacterium]
MSRPLRIELAGGVYHVTARGDRREPIYRDDVDCLHQLEILGRALDRFDARVLAYCQMTNHFHLVVKTYEENLSRFMRQLNGVYSQTYNRRHGVTGHLFEGRFKSVIVDTSVYLAAACRHVERNPVAAGLVAEPGEWRWSSYQAHLGRVEAPWWLDTAAVRAHMLGRMVRYAADELLGAEAYREFVEHVDGDDDSFWDRSLTAQIFLGDEAFAERMQATALASRLGNVEIPRAQRRAPLSWDDCVGRSGGDRDLAIFIGFREAGMTMTELARRSDLSVSQVSRIIEVAEGEMGDLTPAI